MRLRSRQELSRRSITSPTLRSRSAHHRPGTREQVGDGRSSTKTALVAPRIEARGWDEAQGGMDRTETPDGPESAYTGADDIAELASEREVASVQSIDSFAMDSIGSDPDPNARPQDHALAEASAPPHQRSGRPRRIQS